MTENRCTACDPHEADWHAEVIIGQTFCPHGTTCTRKACAHEYGTATSTIDGWFTGERPSVADRDALVPAGWSRIESVVKPCHDKEN